MLTEAKIHDVISSGRVGDAANTLCTYPCCTDAIYDVKEI